MQNRYVGDAGDFGKYGLLRTICGYRDNNEQPDLSLGIAWYLCPDEAHNADGKYVSYLDQTRRNIREYTSCDSLLYAELSFIVHSNSRSVSAIRESRIFNPDTTLYFEEPLDYSAVTAKPNQLYAERQAYRRRWLSDAAGKLAPQQVIFLDPDKSLEPSIAQGHRGADRYAFFDDARAFLQQEPKTIVIYHHLNRSAPAAQQVQEKLAQAAEALDSQPTAALYHRGSSRAFIILPAPQHRQTITERLSNMARTPWQAHFSFHQN